MPGAGPPPGLRQVPGAWSGGARGARSEVDGGSLSDTAASLRTLREGLCAAVFVDGGLPAGPPAVVFTLATPWAGAPEVRTFLWLPGPGSDVLPVHLEAYAAEGDRDEALRELAFADAPVVETVSSPHLGDGIRVLRYAVDPQDDAVVVSLAYARRAEGLDVRLWTSTSDTRLVLLAVEDVDALAQAVRRVDGSGPQRPLS